jgi:hypothetical protein
LDLSNKIYLRIREAEESCEKISEFIEKNKYPLISKLDFFNIKRLQNDQKTMIMTAINEKNSIHMNLIESLIPRISALHRDLVFTYIDTEKDNHLVAYFGIDTDKLPQTVIYDFKEKLYYVDNSEQAKSEESYKNQVETLISKMNKKILSWSTGNWFEDILLKFGIKLDNRAIMWIYGGCFALLLFFIVIVIFFCGDKPDEESQEEHKHEDNTQEDNTQEDNTLKEKKDQ